MKDYRFARVEGWLHAYHHHLGDCIGTADALGDVEYLLKLPDDASRLRTLNDWADLPSGPDEEIALHRYWLAQLFCKWTLPIPGVESAERADAAVRGFLTRNEQAAVASLTPALLSDVKRILAALLPPSEAATLPRLGPGAVAEGYSFLEKRRRLGTYRSSLEATSFGYILPETQVRYSRLCAVPKRWDKDRLITVEPYAHVLQQMEARDYLLACLARGVQRQATGPVYGFRMTSLERRYWKAYIRGTAQEFQRRRILTEHPAHAGKVATVDLSAASDNITYHMVASVFPPHVMAHLDASRTTHICHGDTIDPLHIYAGMGNATTFVVESLLFYAIVKACQKQRHVYIDRQIYETHGSVTVFGDDIICPWPLLPVLQGVGAPIVVNRLKSFGNGHSTRETCGVYTYAGCKLPVFRIHGYGTSAEDLQNICEVYRVTQQLRQEPLYPQAMPWLCAMQDTLEDAVGAHPFSWTVQVCDACLPGTLTLWRAEEDNSTTTRWSPSYQRKEYRVYSCAARYKDVPCPAGLGYVLAALLGSLRTEHQTSRGRTRTMVRLPLKGCRIVSRWMAPIQ